MNVKLIFLNNFEVILNFSLKGLFIFQWIGIHYKIAHYKKENVNVYLTGKKITRNNKT